MRTVGIICEYNPFHRGHAWLLAQLRERYGADTAVVCAMSGNFVQRGDFAIAEKHLRAEAALRGGADLVLELPLPWAISSAEGFARGGVEVLESTGVVDTLCFGSECADGARIKRVAEGLLSEEFSTALRERLTDGGSFAAARQEAAQQILGDDAQILSAPNDILAVEYCKALRSMHSRMEPLALPRRGSAHDGEAQDGFASASYIRQKLIAGGSADEYLTADMARLLAQACAAGRAPVRMETLER
ncbi:MAG: nucleotidyltransferase family protein, partial [Oscillospiraceae bacterium]|nr:nucleotidyltransferase family protein [Oscillospiraceae bacterium]